METHVQVDQMLMGYLLFALVLIRCSGLVVFAPFFGAEHFPRRARVLLAVFLGIVMYPLAAPLAVLPMYLGMAELGVLVLQELAVGLILGFLSSLVFMGAQLSGQLMGQQIGFAMANIVDPLVGREVSILGFFQMNLAIIVFLAAKLHLHLIAALHASFVHVEIGSLAFERYVQPLAAVATVQAHSMFVVAIQLAMPVLLVMLLNSVIVGFVTRTMPQMNIMVLGLPMRLALGMTVFMLVLPALVRAMEGMLGTMASDVLGLFPAVEG